MEKEGLESFHKIGRKLDEHPAAQLIVIGIIVTLIMEMLVRHSIGEAFQYMIYHPLCFASDCVFVICPMSLALFTRKRVFVLFLTGAVWIGLALADCIMLFFRVTPLNAVDFVLLGSVLTIIDKYLTIPQLIACILLVIAGFFLIGVVFRHSRLSERCIRTGITSLIFTGLLCVLSVYILTLPKYKREHFANLTDAYADFGFSSCFVVSAVDNGISQPDDYSDQALDTVKKLLASVPEYTAPELPNIIFLQLESFFDVGHLTEVTVSENPIPNFTRMQLTCSTGFLSVPSIGAGTANTEFEVISEMCIDYFGAAEYPYKTVLQDHSCESICTVLGELGYKSHAIHNNDGTFYDRDRVFAHLGFDTFTSIEYMNGVEQNPIGWADDSILTGEIMKALTSSEQQDLIYTISVQGHGKYPREELEDFEYTYRTTGIEDKGLQLAFEYYLTQIHEMDEFLNELTTALQAFDEPTVLVFFGDHLPSFGLEKDDINNRDLFQTEYVIWSNYALAKEDKDLDAFGLAAEVFERVGISKGIMPRVHQNFSDRKDYSDILELLEYDMLYGEQEIYGSEKPELLENMVMGVVPIRLTEVIQESNGLRLIGENFTPWSIAVIDNHEKETQFCNAAELFVPRIHLEKDEQVRVAQIGEDGVRLSETEALP